ncbi:ABC transporter substrate-binding protein [Alicyclobacillus mali]|uniref:ABC transporter substrate-binding protein n=1 Tax=Alicyclobacillus mali (ex Roth et al. 2021) TaxID=1123961 RepID=A0ABS0F3C2_9BACL|nr:ABC transporter substrate-binding protein [Alicyclobacillus mali (ex Roth et al. 2021)]MBF8377803.1 ABC transporter substrate-binding protein [Alicyclobacillus mali (ex Roth et al. 2021)]
MKRMKSSTWVGAFAAVTLVGMVTGCGQAGTSVTPTKPSTSAAADARATTLTVGLQADPATLDPALSSALVDRQVMANIYDTLFSLTPTGKIVPNLVESYSVSKNGLVYTFQLRRGIKFQDGTPFNAEAVKFNLVRDMSPTSARKSELSSIASVETSGNYTVVIHLSHPYSPLLAVLTDRAGMMVSPTAVKKEGANYADHPVGTGPFMFASRVKGDHITLVANPHYWKGKPKLSAVTFKIFTDPNVEITNLENGSIQLADQVPAQQLPMLEKNSNFVVSNQPGLGYQGIYLNVSQPPFNNKYLRLAVDAAINRSLLVNVALKGEATPAWGPFSPESPVFNRALDLPPAPNTQLVEKYLKEAGDPNGFSFTLQTANNPVSTEIAQIVQSMLQPYHIQMNIEQLEFGTLLANNTDHDFQASALGWSGRIDPDNNAYQFWHTGGAQNGSNFSDPTADKLLDEAREALSMTQRKVYYDSFVQELHRQAPYIFLYFPNNTYAYSKQLHGFQVYPDGVFRLYSMWIS